MAFSTLMRLDEQHLHEAREHEVAAGPPFARFLGDEPHQDRESLDAAHVHQRRQQRHQQCRIGRVEANQPPSSRTSGRPPRVPWRTSPTCADVTFGSNRTGVTASKPDMVKPGGSTSWRST